MKKCLPALLLATFSSLTLAAASSGSRDGELRQQQGNWHAWDAERQRWLDPEDFWRAYADRRGGLTWGSGSEYPPYEQVKEFDTFLVHLPSGNCLMEFFHSRWRLANDVRRWDERFNILLGCPQVFD